MRDDDLLRRRTEVFIALERARTLERERSRDARRAEDAKRERDEDDAEEGQIRDDDERPVKARRGYVPPHQRRDARADEGRGWTRGAEGRSDVGEWRRPNARANADRANEPKLPVPGERGFGFKHNGIGRGRTLEGESAGGRLGGDGGAAAAPPAGAAARARFEDAPREVPPPPPATTRKDERETVAVPSPPRAAVVRAKTPSTARREEPSDDEDDDIEAIQAAARASKASKAPEPPTREEPAKNVDEPAPSRVVEIACVIPDAPAATDAPAPRRSSRRSVSVEREDKAIEDAPVRRRPSRRSVSVERAAPRSVGARDDPVASVNGDLSKLTVVVLKQLLSARGLSVAGLKAALIDRLQSAIDEENARA